MSESGSHLGSMRSGTTGTMSETSSQRSDTKMLRRLKRSGDEREEGDLLEQKRSFQEGVFACMFTLVRQSALRGWKVAVIKIVLEGLMPFIVVFNPAMAWAINTSNPVWQVVRWVVWRSPIMRLYGYDTYILVMYIMAVAVLLSVVGLVWLTMAMRRQEQSRWLRRAAAALNVVYELIFVIFYVSFMDYFVFAANCHFGDEVAYHEYFTDIDCLSMPHILHMSVALAAALVHLLVTALMVVASCDLNPVSRGVLASPDAFSRLKILAAKAAFIVVADDLQTWPKPQAVLLCAAAALICWWNFRNMPFYRRTVNVVWCSMWVAVLYTCTLLMALVFGTDESLEARRSYTMYVLYGIFAAFAGGVVVGAAHVWWAMRPAKKFQELTSFRNIRLQKAHKFSHLHEVEVLSRVMRRFDSDGVVVEDAAAHGEAVIKAGMQSFPSSPFLYVLYANFLLEVHKDPPAARTQLQLALKHAPGLVERYQIYCTMEASKRLKDSQDGGMDLQAYIEFRRNFKAVLRVHKEVLLLEMELWRMCLRSSLRVSSLDTMLNELESATARAHQVYKRVLERYPNNGKLLRCYGKFLEDVRHDGPAAARAYAEAARNGGADAIMSLDLSAVQQASSKPEFLTSLSLVDDAVVVINAEGSIMMVSQAVQSVFGYTKAELEGANVSLLMPQPFSQRHDGYLSRYIATGEARILDDVREVVALHKDRYVFPLKLCVTKMSGSGTDSVFLGVLRPVTSTSLQVRAWLAPNGVFLCGDQQFASMCGINEKDLVGRPLSTLVANSDAEVAAVLERFRRASPSELEAGLVRFSLLLRHRYLEPVPVEVTLGLGGTDDQRILALSCRRTDGQEGNILVVDTHCRIRFASLGVAGLLNYPMRTLTTMRLEQLLPAPFNTLHAKWLRDPPHTPSPTSCRSGKVVHLLNEANTPVAVRLKVSSASGDDVGMSLYVVQVEKVPSEELMEEKRLVISADIGGRVLAVSRPCSGLFGFAAAELVGANLCDCIDIFGEWRKRNGDGQLQLLILALVDREQETPGTSWRVRVHSPAQAAQEVAGALPPTMGLAPSMRRKPSGPATVSACLQIELVTQDDAAAAALPSAADMEDDFLARLTAGATAGATASGGDAAAAAADTASADQGATPAAPVSVGGGVRIRLTLWRRDLLTGLVELDEHLVVRKASPLTGLIVGLPSTAMLKKPLSRFLDLPHHQSWEAIAASHSHKRSALKRGTDRGVVSPLMAFIGPHPDMGTMRILLQGVQTLAPGGRSKVTAVLHPDAAFVGAHADLLRVLHLEDVAAAASAAEAVALGAGAGGEDEDDDNDVRKTAAAGRRSTASRGRGDGQQQQQHQGVERQKSRSGGIERLAEEQEGSVDAGSGGRGSDSESSDSSGGGGGGGGRGRGGRRSVSQKGPSAAGGGAAAAAVEEEDPEAKGQALLHRRASSKSDFVAQWVRTVSRRMTADSLQLQGDAPTTSSAPVAAAVGTAAGGAAAAQPAAEAGNPLPLSAPAPPPPPSPGQAHKSAVGVRSGRLAAIPEESKAASEVDGREGTVAGPRGRGRRGSGGSGGGGGGSGGGGPEAPAQGGDAGDKWDRGSEGGESSADGSQAASGMTSISDAQSGLDVSVDARRCRLLKSLRKVLMGPLLMVPLERLRLHTYLMLALMLATHIVCYVVVTRVVAREHTGVYQVYRQAMAMDRAQLLVVRILIGTYCARPNITDRTSACTPPMSVHLSNMRVSVQTMEEYHQGIYLGFDTSTVTTPDSKVYEVWTHPHWDYHVYMDTSPPTIQTELAGVWQLGNRFIAASREALYWMPKLQEKFKFHRVYQFMVTNGLGALFTGYATSLDLLVDSAWSSLDLLRMDLLILLIVEVVVVQLLALAYQWVLVHRVERVRLLGLVCMVGLPGPVLRQMSNREIKVLDESDDDDDDDDSVKEGDNDRGGGGGTAADKGTATKSPDEHTAAAGGGGAGGGGAPERVVRHSKSSAERAAPPPLPLPAPGPGPMARNGKGKDVDSDPDGGAAAAVGRLEYPGGPKEGALTTAVVASMDESALALSTELAAAPAAGRASDLYETASSRLSASEIGEGERRRRPRWRRLQLAAAMRLANGKVLLTSRWREVRFMFLLLLWFAAVITIYTVSIFRLQGMQGPLASLNMASHVIYRYTRVRAVGFAFLSQDDAASRAVWRDMLSNEVRLFRSEYDALMYGGTAVSQMNSVFQHPVPASTFASSAFSNEFFRTKRCFRYNQTLCAKQGSPYYEVTHNGLDVMVRRMLTEMDLLILDDDQDVRYNTSRWTFMYNVGTFDLYEGLQQAAELFVEYSISRYNQVVTMHTILLVASIVVVLLYILFVLWPLLAKYKADASRQSALLSHVPPEADALGHVRATCRRARVEAGRRRRQSRSTAGAAAGAGAAPAGGASTALVATV